MDFLSDPTFRVVAIPFIAAIGHMMLLAWWDRFKAREAEKPIPMKLRKGVYVPWGRVQRIRRWGDRLTIAWLVYIALLLVALAWTRLF
jgi:hypothetical protein